MKTDLQKDRDRVPDPNDRHFSTEHLLVNLKGRTISSGLVTTVGQVAQFGLNLASIMVLARLLTPQDFGLVAMATTMNGAYADIQRKYPDVHFLLNRRWVQSDSVIFTSGTTGAGIDLALHIVDLYFGREVATRTARYMNYKSQDWTGDGTENVKEPPPSDQFSTGVLGNWEGKVITKDGPLQLAIHIWPYPDDKHLVGAADVLNKDVKDLFIDPIALNGADLHFEIHNGASTYDGKLNTQGTAIEGTWKQSGASMPLVLKRMKT